MADTDGGVYGRGFEIVDTTYGPGMGRLIGYRTHQPRAFEVRFNGNVLISHPAPSLEVTISNTSQPHSRACGPYPHEHGIRCHMNCPSCGGR